MNNVEIFRKARLFESEEIGRMYILAAFLNEWQKECGGTLEEFLEHLEKTFPKKQKHQE